MYVLTARTLDHCKSLPRLLSAGVASTIFSWCSRLVEPDPDTTARRYEEKSQCRVLTILNDGQRLRGAVATFRRPHKANQRQFTLVPSMQKCTVNVTEYTRLTNGAPIVENRRPRRGCAEKATAPRFADRMRQQQNSRAAVAGPDAVSSRMHPATSPRSAAPLTRMVRVLTALQNDCVTPGGAACL